MNATEKMLQINKRRMRAQMMAAELYRVIEPHLDRDADRRTVHDGLMELIFSDGWEVITDAQRAEAGLPPRNEEGWTAEELVALEQHRLDLMTRPIFAPFPIPPRQ